jgi:hypothetical protein
VCSRTSRGENEEKKRYLIISVASYLFRAIREKKNRTIDIKHKGRAMAMAM